MVNKWQRNKIFWWLSLSIIIFLLAIFWWWRVSQQQQQLLVRLVELEQQWQVYHKLDAEQDTLQVEVAAIRKNLQFPDSQCNNSESDYLTILIKVAEQAKLRVIQLNASQNQLLLTGNFRSLVNFLDRFAQVDQLGYFGCRLDLMQQGSELHIEYMYDKPTVVGIT